MAARQFFSTCALLLTLGWLCPGMALAGEATASSLIREEQRLSIDGVEETWRLTWRKAPTPVCSPEEGFAEWGMCPCAGFEFGEAGELDLLRLVPGRAEERLALTPFFRETPAPGACLRRWPLHETDSDQAERPDFTRMVRQRPLARIMVLGDYDHDGQASEFVLQIGAGPCGHQQAVLVGLDPRTSRLRLYGTAEQPERLLILEHPQHWELLRVANGEIEVRQWPCGDHGGEEEETLMLRADQAGLHATRIRRACPDDGSPGQELAREIL
ncbi:MAG: hypothetical protein BWK76_04005 [Desulfobulbaceae bacterium A2]|nr:MAG: hypothetical protein BWK76_04005 [Desulfobulbaceae bacterium A2]